jgi:hypothetical protein
MNAELAQNSAELEATLKKISQEYTRESTEIMDQFIKDLAKAGGIDCKDSDAITEEAEHKVNLAQMRSEQRIAEATENAERRAQQIIMRYQ